MLICFLRKPQGIPDHFLPERFEVFFGQRHGAKRIELIEGDGAIEGSREPLAGGIELAKLAMVAGEVERDDEVGREFIRDAGEDLGGLLKRAAGGAPDRIGEIDPAGSAFRVSVSEGESKLTTVVPLLSGGVDLPADLQDVGMGSGSRGELVEFGGSFGGVAEFEPADGGGNVEDIRRLDLRMRHCS